MPDGDDNGEGEYGGFVFENHESADNEGETGLLDGADTKRIAAAVVLSLAIIVFAVIVVQPLVTGGATQLFGGDSSPGSGPGNATDTTTAGETSSPTDTTAETARGRPTTAATTATRTPPTSAATATPTVGSTTAPPTRTTDRTAETTTVGENTTASETATATPSGRSPAIESFTVTDRSAGGNATFAVAWSVTDPDVDLASIQVTVVADLDGEATTVAQRRFDAGGQSTVGDGTFEIPRGSGTVYEIRMEVVDTADNTVFVLRREVADGEPDG